MLRSRHDPPLEMARVAAISGKIMRWWVEIMSAKDHIDVVGRAFVGLGGESTGPGDVTV